MPLSDKMANPRVQRLHRATPLPTDSMKGLFDAKGPEPLPKQQRDHELDKELWWEFSIRSKAHGAWTQMRWQRCCEQKAIVERIEKGQRYIAEHLLHPNKPSWERQLAELRARRDALEVAIGVFDDVIASEAEHLGAVEDAIKLASGVTTPSFVCGTCQRLVTGVRDHSKECREGWKKLVVAYAEATGQSADHLVEMFADPDKEAGVA